MKFKLSILASGRFIYGEDKAISKAYLNGSTNSSWLITTNILLYCRTLNSSELRVKFVPFLMFQNFLAFQLTTSRTQTGSKSYILVDLRKFVT